MNLNKGDQCGRIFPDAPVQEVWGRVGSAVCCHTDGLDAQLVTGIQGAGKVELLGDQYSILNAEYGTRPIASVVGSTAGIIKDDIVLRDL